MNPIERLCEYGSQQVEKYRAQKPKFFPFENGTVEYVTTSDIAYRIVTEKVKVERPLVKELPFNIRNNQPHTIEVATGIELIPVGKNGEPLIEINRNGIKQTKEGYVICGHLAPIPKEFTLGRERRYIGYNQ